jgi:hypothetical protein
MAEKETGADYGMSSKEEARKSGYRYPDSFYETPKPIDVGKPVEPPSARKTGTKRKAGPAKNKSRTPSSSNK